MDIIRKYKLSKLSGINYLSDTEKEILNLVNSKISNLSEFRIDNYREHHIFYMNKEGILILQYNTQNFEAYVRYGGIWDILRDRYDLPWEDIQNILHYFIKNIYKLDIKFTVVNILYNSKYVESNYKSTIGLKPKWFRYLEKIFKLTWIW